jgi:hypothetical protein
MKLKSSAIRLVSKPWTGNRSRVRESISFARSWRGMAGIPPSHGTALNEQTFLPRTLRPVWPSRFRSRLLERMRVGKLGPRASCAQRQGTSGTRLCTWAKATVSQSIGWCLGMMSRLWRGLATTPGVMTRTRNANVRLALPREGSARRKSMVTLAGGTCSSTKPAKFPGCSPIGLKVRHRGRFGESLNRGLGPPATLADGRDEAVAPGKRTSRVAAGLGR